MLLETWKGVEELEVDKKTGEVRQKSSYMDDLMQESVWLSIFVWGLPPNSTIFSYLPPFVKCPKIGQFCLI